MPVSTRPSWADTRATAYASLPSSPLPPASPVEETQTLTLPAAEIPFSLWDYLREEILATDFDSHQEIKWERVSNFLQVPFAVEKIIWFGLLLCLDSFLYTFTIMPLRAVLSLYRLVMNMARPSGHMAPAAKADILRMILLASAIGILLPITDASKIYHTIRGQDTVKLYVIFNSLEIADRLCIAIGQDILDCLFSRPTLVSLSRRFAFSLEYARPVWYMILAVIYTVAHSLVLTYQLLSLNVAINSYDHSLLTLLVSNQFVEIKGSVFKRFEKQDLFQITCADIVERYQLMLMLSFVAWRNLTELSGTEFDFSSGVPKSFKWFQGHSLIWSTLSPVVTVLLSEIAVDWLKHAFITKFNHIRPSVYDRYADVLSQDLASASPLARHYPSSAVRKHNYVDQSPLVARRLGFASLPLACLSMLIAAQSIVPAWVATRSDDDVMIVSGEIWIRHVKIGGLVVLAWVCLLVIKIILGINLITYATRRKVGMDERAAEDEATNNSSIPIGETKEERHYNAELKNNLSQKRDDAAYAPEMGEIRKDKPSAGDKGRGQTQEDATGRKPKPKLEEMTRFTMIKRIW